VPRSIDITCGPLALIAAPALNPESGEQLWCVEASCLSSVVRIFCCWAFSRSERTLLLHTLRSLPSVSEFSDCFCAVQSWTRHCLNTPYMHAVLESASRCATRRQVRAPASYCRDGRPANFHLRAIVSDYRNYGRRSALLIFSPCRSDAGRRQQRQTRPSPTNFQ
jgi:hypothetical protein